MATGIFSGTVPPNEIQKIQKMTIRKVLAREIWAYTKNGVYNVKS